MSKLTVIDSIEGIDKVYDYLADPDIEFVAFDSETTGTQHKATVVGMSFCASEDEAFYIILQAWDGATLRPIIGNYQPSLGKVLNLLKTKKLIAHNSVFDCQMVETNFGVSLIKSLHTDTMILAHLLNENRRVGLKELGREYFGDDSTKEQAEMKASVIANGGKLTKACYEMYKADAYLLGKYGAQDALLTYKLFLTLVPELYEQELDKFFYEDESMPLLRGPTYELNCTGLKVDAQALTTLKKTLEAECLEAKDFINREIKVHIQDKYPGTKKTNTFNMGSNQQLAWLLFGKLELEFGTLTDAGKTLCKNQNWRVPYNLGAKRQFIADVTRMAGEVTELASIVNGKKKAAKKIKEPWAYIGVDKKVLAKLAPRYLWIAKLLEYQKKKKLLNTYVEGIEERTQYGIIRPSFLQHGTTSGRYASRNPNFQNLPRDDKRIKQAIVARPGRVFVGADQSQLEPRVFAYYSRDKRLLAAFSGPNDFYSVIGMGVYNKTDCIPLKEGHPDAFGIKYKKLRDLSKVIALASTYGATAHQLAPTTGKSIQDTQEDMDNYFEEFPGVATMMIEAHELAKKDGQVVNLFGRPRRMPDALKLAKIYGNIPHAELPYEARNILNLAVNHRIQSTGASIVNRGAIKFCQMRDQLGLDAPLVLQVHDSLVVEAKAEDADTVALLLQEAMEFSVQLEGIAFEAVPKIGNNLSEV